MKSDKDEKHREKQQCKICNTQFSHADEVSDHIIETHSEGAIQVKQ